MGEHNSVYDSNGILVGQFRFGVAWSKNPRKRLGEYDDVDDVESVGYVYDKDRDVIAKYNDGVVANTIGEPIGSYEDEKLFVNDEVVGSCIGSSGASAAAIALIFNRAGTRGDA